VDAAIQRGLGLSLWVRGGAQRHVRDLVRCFVQRVSGMAQHAAEFYIDHPV